MTDRYQNRLRGLLHCYDRIVTTGTLPGTGYAPGMTAFLNAQHIRIFGCGRPAEPLRTRIRANARALAEQHGATIVISNSSSRWTTLPRQA